MMAEKAWQQEDEVIGHMTSIVRKHFEMDGWMPLLG